jgi:hypothetical protein
MVVGNYMQGKSPSVEYVVYNTWERLVLMWSLLPRDLNFEWTSEEEKRDRERLWLAGDVSVCHSTKCMRHWLHNRNVYKSVRQLYVPFLLPLYDIHLKDANRSACQRMLMVSWKYSAQVQKLIFYPRPGCKILLTRVCSHVLCLKTWNIFWWNLVFGVTALISINFSQTKQYHIPKNYTLHSYCHKNLHLYCLSWKQYIVQKCYMWHEMQILLIASSGKMNF